MTYTETTYSKIVQLKKRIFKTPLIPKRLAYYIDTFFNTLHNLRIQTKDITRDTIIRSKDILRDYTIKSKDIVRDYAIQSKDILTDEIIRGKDTLRDYTIQSKDILKDEIIRGKDTLKDYTIQSRDLVRDSIIDSRDKVRDSIVITKDVVHDKFINVKEVAKNTKFALIRHIFSAFKLIPYLITEKSDQEAVSHIQKIIANSQNVKNRIRTYYGKDAVIIHPPIDVINTNKSDKDTINSRPFWLSVNRITAEKRVNLQLEAFRKMPDRKLIIVGGYDSNSNRLVSELFTNCPENISYIGNVNSTELNSLYASCTGFITTALHEDFGMTVVEALASGKPVIAPNEGGYKETIVNGVHGVLIHDINADKIVNAVGLISDKLSKNRDCYVESNMKQARKFDTSIFIKKIQDEIKESISQLKK